MQSKVMEVPEKKGQGPMEKEKKEEKNKEKEKKKWKEKEGAMGSVHFKIQGATSPQKSLLVKASRFKHYKESTSYMK